MSYLILATRLRRKIDYAIDILEFIESVVLRDVVRQILEGLKKELVAFNNLLAKKDNILAATKIVDHWGTLQKNFLSQWQQMVTRDDLRTILSQQEQDNLQIDWIKTIENEIKESFQSSPELEVDDLREVAKGRLLEYELVQFSESIKPLLSTKPPSCFISYAWGNKVHENQVHQIAYLLKRAGIEVLLDIWCNKVNSVPAFTELISKQSSDFVVVVGTHLLRQKYEIRTRGKGSWVGEELDLIGVRKYEYPNDHGIIKLLLEKSSESLEKPAAKSFPEFLNPLAHDYTDFDLKQNYYDKFFNLLELLYAKNPIIKDKLLNLRQAFFHDNEIIHQATKEQLVELLQLNNPIAFEKEYAEKETVFLKLKQASRLFSQFVEREFSNELLYAEILRNRLQSKYAENDKIKRLFYPYNPLPIANCYLHLALVQDKEIKHQQDKVKQESAPRDYLLHEYERIDHIQQKLAVHEILRECKSITKRIFIEGAAGAGKSTLCQRIAYDWSQGKEPWKDYKWLFHIRLRDLRNTDQNTKDYLRTIIINCFQHGHAPLHKWQVKKIISEMQSTADKPKVLFLLDGYDELHLDQDTLKKLLQPLKDYDFIVTSRPGSNFKIDVANHNMDTKQLLHLAVLGFNDQQVKQYVNQFFNPKYTPEAKSEEEKACLEGLQNNHNLWSLAHIPIQLELLCSIWGEELKNQSTINLTSLYELMLEKLLIRLEIERRDTGIGDVVVDHLKESTYNQPLAYLSYLAYLGMKDGKIVLEQKNHIEKALKDLKITEAPKIFFNTLRDLGLFKRSHDGKQGEFIHLTFQEYFAAKYIANMEFKKFAETLQIIFLSNWDTPLNLFISGLIKELDIKREFFRLLMEKGSRAKNNIFLINLFCRECKLDANEFNLSEIKNVFDEIKDYTFYKLEEIYLERSTTISRHTILALENPSKIIEHAIAKIADDEIKSHCGNLTNIKLRENINRIINHLIKIKAYQRYYHDRDLEGLEKAITIFKDIEDVVNRLKDEEPKAYQRFKVYLLRNQALLYYYKIRMIRSDQRKQAEVNELEEKSQELANEAVKLEINNSKNHTVCGSVYYEAGLNKTEEQQQENIQKAIEHYKKALDLLVKDNNNRKFILREIANIKHNIAVCYMYRLKNKAEAIKILEELFDHYKNKEKPLPAIYVNNMCVACYGSKKLSKLVETIQSNIKKVENYCSKHSPENSDEILSDSKELQTEFYTKIQRVTAIAVNLYYYFRHAAQIGLVIELKKIEEACASMADGFFKEQQLTLIRNYATKTEQENLYTDKAQQETFLNECCWNGEYTSYLKQLEVYKLDLDTIITFNSKDPDDLDISYYKIQQISDCEEKIKKTNVALTKNLMKKIFMLRYLAIIDLIKMGEITEEVKQSLKADVNSEDSNVRELANSLLGYLKQNKIELFESDKFSNCSKFQHFLQPGKVRVAIEPVPVKQIDNHEIQGNLTSSAAVARKKMRLAQTYFYAKPTPIALSKRYTVQIAQQIITFEVQAVAGDGDCGYTAFGITRTQAYQLLIDHLNEIRPLIKPALQEALRTHAFIEALRSKGHLTQSLSIAYANYLQPSQGGEMPQSVLDELDKTSDDLATLLAYIEYDVKDKQIDAGWSHPCILFALAEIQSIGLHLWQETSRGELISHPYYAQHIPAHVTQRTDLLFVNGNHFERLELVTGLEPTYEASNTNVFSAL